MIPGDRLAKAEAILREIVDAHDALSLVRLSTRLRGAVKERTRAARLARFQGAIYSARVHFINGEAKAGK